MFHEASATPEANAIAGIKRSGSGELLASFRQLALSLPGATEGTHHGVADFRVGDKIFATLAYESKGFGTLMLTPDEQLGMITDAPGIFSPVPNAWGRKGATLVNLKAVKADILEAALRLAWRRRAPTSLLDPQR